ncbi:unnamed protein product [Amoebophrya sp. A120]|nr:unnamed protein product [Amoebophrya sp. A120]|eukprot:GSA120T00022531001.1
MSLTGLKQGLAKAQGGAPGGLVQKDRQRLTVGAIDPKDAANANNGAKAGGRPSNNRGLVQFLKANDTIACASVSSSLRSSTGSSVCLSSETVRRQNSFDEKRLTKEGDPTFDIGKLAAMGVAIGCKKGKKPESPNQDSYAFVHCPDDFTLYTVFDGHGVNGHDVSNFCKEYMIKLFISDPNRDTNTEKAFADTFRKAQQMLENEMASQIDSRTSGATATMIYRPAGKRELHVAYCGDSRASICFATESTTVVPGTSQKPNGRKQLGVELTRDHKPELPEEKRRIESSGGVVLFDGYYNHRVFKRGTVYPGLNMSRAMGDVIGNREAGIVETPDYKIFELTDEVIAFLVCSDGVWEFIDCHEAATIVHKHKDKETGKINCEKAAEELCRESYQRWMDDTGGEISDDITAMIQVL